MLNSLIGFIVIVVAYVIGCITTLVSVLEAQEEMASEEKEKCAKCRYRKEDTDG